MLHPQDNLVPNITFISAVKNIFVLSPSFFSLSLEVLLGSEWDAK